MKKNCAFILILIVLLCVTLSACKVGQPSPWGDKIVDNNGSDSNGDNNGDVNGSVTKTIKIYVCGAVKNEGYYEVSEGETYLAAITQAGLLDCSWLPNNATSTVDERKLFVVVQYLENGVAHDCYNANSIFFALRDPMRFEGLSEEVINKLADYLEAHEKIPNQTVLREVLGDDYEDYHYKLYIAEADYEEAD